MIKLSWFCKVTGHGVKAPYYECKSCGARLSQRDLEKAACPKCNPKQAQAAVDVNGKKKVTETRCTCNKCKKVWHYKGSDQLKETGKAMSQFGKSMLCCSGCFPALLIPNKESRDLDQCPNCKSRDVKKETVEHYV